jgi:hypothetical protein
VRDEGPAPNRLSGDQDDAESSEALSRAAREAVRQPADPRLERSFARLGLFTEDEVAVPRPGEPVHPVTPDRAPAAAPSGPGRPAVASPVPSGAAAPAPAEFEALQAEVDQLEVAVRQLSRQLTVVTALLVATVLGVAVLLLLSIT